MKLRNKKTGEIGELRHIIDNEKSWFEVKTKTFAYVYNPLAELNEEWQDYEEPKKGFKKFLKINRGFCVVFYDEETAEKEFEKAKAWQRLKDNGFRIKSYEFDYLLYAHRDGTPVVKVICDFDCGTEEDKADLDLLFGGRK